MTNKELTIFRKRHYWRGFKVCLLIMIPLVVYLMFIINSLIKVI